MTRWTAVQERTSDEGRRATSATVLYGAPSERVSGARGPIALYPPGRVILYVVRQQGRARAYLFRTVGDDDHEPLATQIPGVRPAVRVLCVAHTGRRIYRAGQLIRVVERRGQSPDQLSDGFYLRAGTTLARRSPVQEVVDALLRQER